MNPCQRKACQRCLPEQTVYVPLYSEEELHIHELFAHNKCEVCGEFFHDIQTRAEHLADMHGKMYLSREEPPWPEGLSELVDIPQWQRRIVKPETTPADPASREHWLKQFALLLVDEVAAGRADNFLKRPPPEFRDQAQYVNWVQTTYPKSAGAWKTARYQKRARSKNAKANFLAKAWTHPELGAPTYLKQKGL